MMAWRSPALAVAIVMTCGVTVLAPTVALAADPVTSTPVAPSPLHLVRQTLWIQPNGTASIVLAVDRDIPDDAEIATSVHGQVKGDRTAFTETIAGTLRTTTIGTTSAPVADLARDALGNVVVSIPTTTTRERDKVRLSVPGVYPVEIELRRGDTNEVLGKLITYLVRLPDPLPPGSPPLRIAVILPIDGPPAIQPDGAVSLTAADLIRAGATTQALADHPDIALTVAPRPELLQALARSANPDDVAVASRLAASVGARQLLATPYLRVDATSLVTASLEAELSTQLTAGETALTALLPSSRPDRRTWLADANLDERTLTTLRSLGISQVIAPPGLLTAGQPLTTTTRPVAVGGAVPLRAAFVADASLTARFASTAEPVLKANQMLAELAFVALSSSPPVSAARGLVLEPPPNWQPSPELLDAVLTGLGTMPLVEPVTVDALFAALGDGGPNPTMVQLTPTSAAAATQLTRPIQLARLKAATIGSMVETGAPPLERLDEILLYGTAADLAPEARQVYLTEASDRLEQVRTSVRPPGRQTITLTARSGEIPLIITSTAPFPIRVKVRLTADKLTFPKGREQIVEVQGPTRIRFPVETRASGTFPLTVELLTPTGDVPVTAPTRLSIRSTAIAGVGIVLSIGAGLVLAGWWVLHLRRRHRAKVTAGAERHPSGPERPVPVGDGR